jgi:hypothetical protein
MAPATIRAVDAYLRNVIENGYRHGSPLLALTAPMMEKTMCRIVSTGSNTKPMITGQSKAETK